MKTERLLALYDRVAEAPGAIPCLRRFVLDLAVRGKLVEQNPTDEPAAELLKRFAAEKACLAKSGELKGRKHSKTVPPNSLDFSLRSGWAAARLSDLLIELQTGPFGSSLHQRDYEIGGTPVINPTSIQEGKIVSIEKMAVGNTTLERLSTFKLRKGDIVMGRRGEMGRCAVVTDQEDGWLCGTGSLILRLPSDSYAEYLVMLIGSPLTREYLSGSSVGATMRNLNQSILLGMSIGVPPIAEQRRIVAKVDQLMALCDQLEETRSERENTRDQLTKSCLARLTAPDTNDETFGAHAGFAVDVFPALTTRADQVKQLRETILNLAVRGKLVDQNPADEPASELLKRIAAEKARLVRAGKIRKSRVVVPLDTDEIPFPHPSGWAWTQIACLGLISPHNEAPDSHEASFVPMPMMPVKYGATSTHEARRWGDIKKGYTHFAEGDVGLAKITPCFENGKSTVFRNLTGGIGSGTTELHIVRPLIADADYIVLFFKSPQFIGNGIPKMTGTAGQKRVPTEYFTSSPFPLPPLAEQRRIVAKVDQLMVLCNRLESSLGAADISRQRLIKSLLQDVLLSKGTNTFSTESAVAIGD